MENVSRIVRYLILVGLTGLMFFFFHSHYFFMALVAFVVAPFLSVSMAYFLKKKCEVDISAVDKLGEYCNQDEEAYFSIRVKNPTIFVCLDAKIALTVGNTFFETEGNRVISVPVHPFKGYKLQFPVVPKLPGIIKLKANSIKIKDLMGFVSFNIQLDKSAEISVMPATIDNVAYDKTILNQGSLESEESSKKGNDFSDVQEIREYIPGDKLMSIHWKLSAKRDILMVKDRMSMSDRQLVVLPELSGSNYELNVILSVTYSMIKKLIEDKTTVRLMYWSKTEYRYYNTRIDYIDELNTAFEQMYYQKRYSNMNEAAEHMPLVNQEMKSYLHIYSDGGQICANIKENS